MENACSLPATSSQSQLFDVGIICNDVCYGAHKCILATQSTSLKRLFIMTAKETGNAAESFQIVMDDIEEIDVVNILTFCYDGEIAISKEEVKGFLMAGKLLQLDPVLQLIEQDEDFREVESDSFQEKFNARVANNDEDNNNKFMFSSMEENDEEDDDIQIIDIVSGEKQRDRRQKLLQVDMSADKGEPQGPLPKKRPRPSIVIYRISNGSKTFINYTHSETGKLMELKRKSPEARFLKIEGDLSSNDGFSQSSSFNHGTLAFSGINSYDDKSATNSNACWMLADTIDSLRPSQTPLTT